MDNSTTNIHINDNTKNPSISAKSQEWMRTWGEINSDDTCMEMDVYNKTGDVYLIGENQTVSPSKILFIKYNSSGDLEWDMEFQFKGSSSEGQDVVVHQNTGEIYILATVYNGGNHDDIFIAKYYDNGTQIWNTTWGNDSYEYGAGISYDNAGYLYVSGYIRDFDTYNDKIILVKFDRNSGNQVWNATWDTSFDDIAYDVACGPYGEIYITGYTEVSANDIDMVLIRYDNNNVQKWNITWGIGSYKETGNAVGVDSYGDIYITGTYENDPNRVWGMFLCKYNSSSVFKWSIRYTSSSNQVYGYDLYIDANDHIFVAMAGYASYYWNSLMVQGYNRRGEIMFESYWNAVTNFLVTSAVSGYGSNIYVVGNMWDASPVPRFDIILVKNPSEDFPFDEDEDEDEDDDNDPAIPGYDSFLIIGIIGLVSTLIIINFKKRKR